MELKPKKQEYKINKNRQEKQQKPGAGRALQKPVKGWAMVVCNGIALGKYSARNILKRVVELDETSGVPASVRQQVCEFCRNIAQGTSEPMAKHSETREFLKALKYPVVEVAKTQESEGGSGQALSWETAIKELNSTSPAVRQAGVRKIAELARTMVGQLPPYHLHEEREKAVDRLMKGVDSVRNAGSVLNDFSSQERTKILTELTRVENRARSNPAVKKASEGNEAKGKSSSSLALHAELFNRQTLSFASSSSFSVGFAVRWPDNYDEAVKFIVAAFSRLFFRRTLTIGKFLNYFHIPLKPFTFFNMVYCDPRTQELLHQNGRELRWRVKQNLNPTSDEEAAELKFFIAKYPSRQVSSSSTNNRLSSTRSSSGAQRKPGKPGLPAKPRTLTVMERRKIRLAAALARQILEPYHALSQMYSCHMHTLLTINILSRLDIAAHAGYSREYKHLCLIIYKTGHYVDVFPQDASKLAGPLLIIAPGANDYYSTFKPLETKNEMLQRLDEWFRRVIMPYYDAIIEALLKDNDKYLEGKSKRFNFKSLSLQQDSLVPVIMAANDAYVDELIIRFERAIEQAGAKERQQLLNKLALVLSLRLKPIDEFFGPRGSSGAATIESARRVSRFLSETRTKSYLPQDAERVLYEELNKAILSATLVEPLNVLDLMSGTHTYLPEKISASQVVGIGLKMEELKLNRKLTERIERDVNRNTKLPFSDNHFDVVIITCGMAYIKRPEVFFSSIFRVLKPGGLLFIAFNDQYYGDDAVADWRGITRNAMAELVKSWIKSGAPSLSVNHEIKYYTIGQGSCVSRKPLDIITAVKPKVVAQSVNGNSRRDKRSLPLAPAKFYSRSSSASYTVTNIELPVSAARIMFPVWVNANTGVTHIGKPFKKLPADWVPFTNVLQITHPRIGKGYPSRSSSSGANAVTFGDVVLLMPVSPKNNQSRRGSSAADMPVRENEKHKFGPYLHRSASHEECLYWIQHAVAENQLKKPMTLMLFDLHCDLKRAHLGINESTWVLPLLEAGYISHVVWVLPTWARELSKHPDIQNDIKYIKQLIEAQKQDHALQAGKKELPHFNISYGYPQDIPGLKLEGDILVSFDFDFFSADDWRGFNANRKLHHAAQSEITKSIDDIFSILHHKNIRPVAFDLCQGGRSGQHYVYHDQVELIDRLLTAKIHKDYGSPRSSSSSEHYEMATRLYDAERKLIKMSQTQIDDSKINISVTGFVIEFLEPMNMNNTARRELIEGSLRRLFAVSRIRKAVISHLQWMGLGLPTHNGYAEYRDRELWVARGLAHFRKADSEVDLLFKNIAQFNPGRIQNIVQELEIFPEGNSITVVRAGKDVITLNADGSIRRFLNRSKGATRAFLSLLLGNNNRELARRAEIALAAMKEKSSSSTAQPALQGIEDLIDRLKNSDKAAIIDAAIKLGGSDLGDKRQEALDNLRRVRKSDYLPWYVRAAARIAMDRIAAYRANIPGEYCAMTGNKFKELFASVVNDPQAVRRFANVLDEINRKVIADYRSHRLYPLLCGSANRDAYDILLEKRYPVSFVKLIPEHSGPKEPHWVNYVTVGKTQFLLDCAADEYERVDNKTIIEVSPVLIPLQDITKWPRLFPVYQNCEGQDRAWRMHKLKWLELPRKLDMSKGLSIEEAGQLKQNHASSAAYRSVGDFETEALVEGIGAIMDNRRKMPGGKSAILSAAGLVIQPATTDDLGAITNIVFQDYYRYKSRNPEKDAKIFRKYTEQMLKSKTKKPGKVFVAKLNGQMVGFIRIFFELEIRRGNMGFAVVKREFRNRGIATKLAIYAMNWFLGRADIDSLIGIDNSEEVTGGKKPSANIAARLGFERQSKTGIFIFDRKTNLNHAGLPATDIARGKKLWKTMKSGVEHIGRTIHIEKNHSAISVVALGILGQQHNFLKQLLNLPPPFIALAIFGILILTAVFFWFIRSNANQPLLLKSQISGSEKEKINLTAKNISVSRAASSSSEAAKAFHDSVEDFLRQKRVPEENIKQIRQAMENSPREHFVESKNRHCLYSQTFPATVKKCILTSGNCVAYEAALLKLGGAEKLLHIGTGSGWTVSIFSYLLPRGRVTTLDVDECLIAHARNKIRAIGRPNIEFIHGDGFSRLPELSGRIFDRILVEGALPGGIPAILLDRLAPGGILIVSCLYPDSQSKIEKPIFWRIHKTSGGKISAEAVDSTMRFQDMLVFPDIEMVPLLPNKHFQRLNRAEISYAKSMYGNPMRARRFGIPAGSYSVKASSSQENIQKISEPSVASSPQETESKSRKKLKDIVEATIFDDFLDDGVHLSVYGCSSKPWFPVIKILKPGVNKGHLLATINFVRHHMGGIVPPFSILRDVKVKIKKDVKIIEEHCDLLIVQKRMFNFRENYYLLPERFTIPGTLNSPLAGKEIELHNQFLKLRKYCIERGIVIYNFLTAYQYGVDPDDGTLYLIDFIWAEEISAQKAITSYDQVPYWRSPEKEAIDMSIWASKARQQFEVPNVEIPRVSSSGVSMLTDTYQPNFPAEFAGRVGYQILVDRFDNGDLRNDPTIDDIGEIWNVPEKERSTFNWKPRKWDSNWYDFDEFEKQWASRSGHNQLEIMYNRHYGGDLQGVLNRLDYLKKLGIGFIYFNQLFWAPSHSKYDGASFHHIDPTFGPNPAKDKETIAKENPIDPKTWIWTEADKLFLKVIQEAHKRGIKVVLDGVFNHTGKYFFAFKDVLTQGKKSKFINWYDITAWSNDANSRPVNWRKWFGYSHLPEIRREGDSLHGVYKEYVFNCLTRWMKPGAVEGKIQEGIDGWRLDVFFCLPSGFRKELYEEIKKINPRAIVIAEGEWEAAHKYVQENSADSAMNYPYLWMLEDFLINQKKRIPASEFCQKMQKVFDAYPQQAAHVMFNLLGSHDTERIVSAIRNPDMNRWAHMEHNSNSRLKNNSAYDIKMGDEITRRIQKLLVLYQMTSPGMPVIFYGDEIGMPGANDPCCRKPMPWPDKIVPVSQYYPDYNLLKFYQKLIAIRNRSEALKRGSYEVVYSNDEEQIMGFKRQYQEEKVFVFINGSNKTHSLNLTLSTDNDNRRATNIINGKAYSLKNGKLGLTLPAMSGSILSLASSSSDGEVILSSAFIQFSKLCRAEIALMKQYIERKDARALLASVKNIKTLIRAHFLDPDVMQFFRDALQVCDGFSMFIRSAIIGDSELVQISKLLERFETELTGLEALQRQKKLSDAIRKWNSEDILNGRHSSSAIVNVPTSRTSDRISEAAPAENSKPSFDVSVPQLEEVLFPLSKIKKVLSERGEDTDIYCDPREVSKERIVLYLRNRGDIVARLSMRIMREIATTSIEAKFPFASIFATKNTYCQRALRDPLRIYKNIKPAVVIDDFRLAERLRHKNVNGKTIGQWWYDDYLEPYLLRCGFPIIAVEGNCITIDYIKEFFSQRGFRGFIFLRMDRGKHVHMGVKQVFSGSSVSSAAASQWLHKTPGNSYSRILELSEEMEVLRNRQKWLDRQKQSLRKPSRRDIIQESIKRFNHEKRLRRHENKRQKNQIRKLKPGVSTKEHIAGIHITAANSSRLKNGSLTVFLKDGASSSGSSVFADRELKKLPITKGSLSGLLSEANGEVTGSHEIGTKLFVFHNLSVKHPVFCRATEGSYRYSKKEGTLSIYNRAAALFVGFPWSSRIKKLLALDCINCVGVAITASLPDGRVALFLSHFFNAEDGEKPNRYSAKESDWPEATLRAVLETFRESGVHKEKMKVYLAGGHSKCGEAYARRIVSFLRSRNIAFDNQCTGGKITHRNIEIDIESAGRVWINPDYDYMIQSTVANSAKSSSTAPCGIGRPPSLHFGKLKFANKAPPFMENTLLLPSYKTSSTVSPHWKTYKAIRTIHKYIQISLFDKQNCHKKGGEKQHKKLSELI